MELHPETRTCPGRGHLLLSRRGYAVASPSEVARAAGRRDLLDRDVTSGGRTGIASQPLLPAETRMRALRPGKDDFHERWGSGGGRRQAHLQALVSHEVLAGAPMDSPTPIAPEQRGRTHRERMQQHADLARLRGFAALPLTLLAQRTRTTTADAGSIHDAQAPVSFSALLVWGQLLGSRAPQRSIGLESKVLGGATALAPAPASDASTAALTKAPSQTAGGPPASLARSVDTAAITPENRAHRDPVSLGAAHLFPSLAQASRRRKKMNRTRSSRLSLLFVQLCVCYGPQKQSSTKECICRTSANECQNRGRNSKPVAMTRQEVCFAHHDS